MTEKNIVKVTEFGHNIYKEVNEDAASGACTDTVTLIEEGVKDLPIREDIELRAQVLGHHPLDLSAHTQLVAAFNSLAKQPAPANIEIPSADKRILRAKLIFEEAMEVIEALGVDVEVESHLLTDRATYKRSVHDGIVYFKDNENVKVDQVAKECCDLRVVTTGTLVAFGIPDTYVLQNLVDTNNLLKFRTDKDGHLNEYGKWVKPTDHPSPKIKEFLKHYGYNDD